MDMCHVDIIFGSYSLNIPSKSQRVWHLYKRSLPGKGFKLDMAYTNIVILKSALNSNKFEEVNIFSSEQINFVHYVTVFHDVIFIWRHWLRATAAGHRARQVDEIVFCQYNQEWFAQIRPLSFFSILWGHEIETKEYLSSKVSTTIFGQISIIFAS